jgi:hypothetical protein
MTTSKKYKEVLHQLTKVLFLNSLLLSDKGKIFCNSSFQKMESNQLFRATHDYNCKEWFDWAECVFDVDADNVGYCPAQINVMVNLKKTIFFNQWNGTTNPLIENDHVFLVLSTKDISACGNGVKLSLGSACTLCEEYLLVPSTSIDRPAHVISLGVNNQKKKIVCHFNSKTEMENKLIESCVKSNIIN